MKTMYVPGCTINVMIAAWAITQGSPDIYNYGIIQGPGQFSMMTGLGWMTEVLFQAGARDFAYNNVQTALGAHPQCTGSKVVGL